MGKHTEYGPERALFRDARSGLKIIRLTHGPAISQNLYFEMCSFTSDDRFVVFASQRYAGRDAPMDLFRCSTDGLVLQQLTELDDLAGVVVSHATDEVFFQSGRQLWKKNILTLEETVVASLPGERCQPSYSLGSIDRAGRLYFSNAKMGEERAQLFKVNTTSGELTVLHEGRLQNHIHVDPTGRHLHFNDYGANGWAPHLIDTDGTNLREYRFRRFAHHTWFGEEGRMQGTLLTPGQGIVLWTEGQEEPEEVASGRYYWHSGCSQDAQWIVSDTNWPKEGLYLIHVPSGVVTYICDPRSSCTHPQWTHPHPSFSPNMKFVLFNSDMTGVGQVYLAVLTDEFLTQAAKGHEGELDLL